MTKVDSKQMRVAKLQYELLGKLAKALGTSRVEVLNNTIALAKFLVDNKATTVKAVCADGSEKEVVLAMLLGMDNED